MRHSKNAHAMMQFIVIYRLPIWCIFTLHVLHFNVTLHPLSAIVKAQFCCIKKKQCFTILFALHSNTLLFSIVK